MNAQKILEKANHAATSAKMLLDDGDNDGACNRAYYAIFDAARAALLASDASVNLDAIRTHNGLISAFSLRLVKTGHVPFEYGRVLNRAEELRLIADYRGDSLEKDDAAWMVTQAVSFIKTMRHTFMDDGIT